MKKTLLFLVFLVAVMLPVTAHAVSDDFVDVSSWNGTLSTSDFLKLKSADVKGEVVKLTEGTYYLNPYAKTQVANGRKAGLQVSAYHYSVYLTESQARNEARYFANTAKSYGFSKDDLLVNDLEENKLPNKNENTLAFFDELKKQGFSNVILYTSGGWIDSGKIQVSKFDKKNIWVASYPYDPAGKKWYSDFAAWQWTSTRKFSGVSCNFDVSSDYTGRFTEKNQITEDVEKPKEPSSEKPKENYKLIPESSSFSPDTTINIRSNPSTKAKILGHYDKGESFYYDSYCLNEGYVWVHYISYSGKDCFVATRNQGKEAWGTFGKSKTRTVIVKAGDTLSSIAARIGKSVSYLVSKNSIKNANLIYSGQTLIY